jgi:hypothetical protein
MTNYLCFIAEIIFQDTSNFLTRQKLHGETLLRQDDKYRFVSLIPQINAVSLSG